MSRSQTTFYEALDELIAAKDSLFVPVVKAPSSPADELARLFQDIVAFHERHGRAPDRLSRAPDEMRLGIRLETFRNDPEKIAKLAHLDTAGLLAAPSLAPVPTTIDELLAAGDDYADLLATPDDHIFDFKETPAPQPKAEADIIAERIRCRDFDRFRPIFDAAIADIANGIRSTTPTSRTSQIEVGDMFILDGQFAYIADVRERETSDSKDRGDKSNIRLRVIYDNGTESDHLLPSFGKALWRSDNSRRVISPEAGPLFDGQEAPIAGRVYIARTLCQSSELADLAQHMIKIGSTTGDAQSRLATAKTDPTFLLAEAKLLVEFDTRVQPARVERILHRFFADACVSVRVPDRFGKSVDPREWFLVSPEAVEQAMELINQKSLHLYRYNVQDDRIELKT
ncbi:GIY-YIG nuclease family protein [Sphingomonas sp. HDW15A]|uniref:GIY-YIG nuclease family protein n=1 Tax=Sphingomonas sp. HDW15A TaxID=2714942 RepID=UPI00140D947C|nr:GIY-YIG nuclease family protein [Sphingomonas sp. HDW15A]QIK95558.1 GIY-YIG nuclease family protein [Sphingomonas sp. HDW15A]